MMLSTTSIFAWRKAYFSCNVPKLFRPPRKTTKSGLVAVVALIFGIGSSPAQTASPQPLSANDVSILFPAPKNTGDLANLIALSDLAGPSGAPQPERLWSTADFGRFLAITEDPNVQVAGPGLPIVLPPDAKQIDAWFIAGIRIDPGAPGLSSEIIAQYGQQPQIRFIAQPVTRQANGQITIHDVAAHLIFSFSLPPPQFDPPAATGCLQRPKPDMASFQPVIRDITALRDGLLAGQFGGVSVDTKDRPLNVHPGLTGASAKAFRDAVKAMLAKHLVPQRLTSMAVMALHAPEPWIFVSMQKVPVGGQLTFVPVNGPMLNGQQVAEMLSFRGGKHVLPAPATNNQNPITCRHAAFQSPPLPASDRKGVATADFLDGNLTETQIRGIVDIIANPAMSHFFNTDCVSCHTDTRQAIQRISGFTVPGVAPEALPQETWNVRNFGWFPSFFRSGVVEPTVTRRTANETADVVAFINRELLGR